MLSFSMHNGLDWLFLICTLWAIYFHPFPPPSACAGEDCASLDFLARVLALLLGTAVSKSVCSLESCLGVYFLYKPTYLIG